MAAFKTCLIVNNAWSCACGVCMKSVIKLIPHIRYESLKVPLILPVKIYSIYLDLLTFQPRIYLRIDLEYKKPTCSNRMFPKCNINCSADFTLQKQWLLAASRFPVNLSNFPSTSHLIDRQCTLHKQHTHFLLFKKPST